MYRDDKDAADALAAKLVRDNAELADDKAKLAEENAKLKAELARRPTTSKQDEQNAAKKKWKAENKKLRTALARGPVYNWCIRGACGIAVAVAAFTITKALYPVFNHGITDRTFQPILSAFISQIWTLSLIAQPILGWWTDEEASGGYVKLKKRSRVLMILGGIVAVVATAAFVALVGESSGGL